MFNTDATFTDADKNLPAYFGIYTSQRTMNKKPNGIIPHHKILTRTTETLSQYDFDIHTFEKSLIFAKKNF